MSPTWGSILNVSADTAFRSRRIALQSMSASAFLPAPGPCAHRRVHTHNFVSSATTIVMRVFTTFPCRSCMFCDRHSCQSQNTRHCKGLCLLTAACHVRTHQPTVQGGLADRRATFSLREKQTLTYFVIFRVVGISLNQFKHSLCKTGEQFWVMLRTIERIRYYGLSSDVNPKRNIWHTP